LASTNLISSGIKDESLASTNLISSGIKYESYKKFIAERNQILGKMEYMEQIMMRVLLITFQPLPDIVKKRMKISDKLLSSNVETLSQYDIDSNLKEMKSLDMDVNNIYTSLQKYLFISLPPFSFSISGSFKTISKIDNDREKFLNYLEKINQTNKETYIKQYKKYLQKANSLDKEVAKVVEVCISEITRLYEVLKNTYDKIQNTYHKKYKNSEAQLNDFGEKQMKKSKKKYLQTKKKTLQNIRRHPQWFSPNFLKELQKELLEGL
jgi:hypothetical protein